MDERRQTGVEVAEVTRLGSFHCDAAKHRREVVGKRIAVECAGVVQHVPFRDKLQDKINGVGGRGVTIKILSISIGCHTFQRYCDRRRLGDFVSSTLGDLLSNPTVVLIVKAGPVRGHGAVSSELELPLHTSTRKCASWVRGGRSLLFLIPHLLHSGSIPQSHDSDRDRSGQKFATGGQWDVFCRGERSATP